jgi:L-ribulose-5-phosphate 3-epimerase
MKTGITQCCMWDSTPKDFIAAAGKAGYDVVELMLRDKGDLTPGTDAVGLAAIRKSADDAGVKIFSLALLHLTNQTIEAGDGQKKCIEQITAGLKTAKALGATSTLLTLGRPSPELYYDDAYRNAVATLKAVGPIADSLGVDIAIEFVWTGFLFSPLEMRRFLDEVDHPRIGFYFDPGNMAVFQLPQHWVRVVGKRTKLVHLKDWKGGALNGGWTALLKGGVDFKAVMNELHAIGYNGPLTSEVDPKDAPLEETLRAIRQIAGM